MWTDPIVEEVRKARDEYAKELDYDLHRLFEDLRAREQSGDREIVTVRSGSDLTGGSPR